MVCIKMNQKCSWHDGSEVAQVACKVEATDVTCRIREGFTSNIKTEKENMSLNQPGKTWVKFEAGRRKIKFS